MNEVEFTAIWKCIIANKFMILIDLSDKPMMLKFVHLSNNKMKMFLQFFTCIPSASVLPDSMFKVQRERIKAVSDVLLSNALIKRLNPETSIVVSGFDCNIYIPYRYYVYIRLGLNLSGTYV